jgi:hypothetical protein
MFSSIADGRAETGPVAVRAASPRVLCQIKANEFDHLELELNSGYLEKFGPCWKVAE